LVKLVLLRDHMIDCTHRGGRKMGVLVGAVRRWEGKVWGVTEIGAA